jgi:hypothetical protein
MGNLVPYILLGVALEKNFPLFSFIVKVFLVLRLLGRLVVASLSCM